MISKMNPQSIVTAILILLINISVFSQALPDSIVYHNTDFDVGQTFYTGYFTSFGHVTSNSFIEDKDDGFLHLAYTDNYELYYFKSTDEGLTWIKEQIMTGHEGDIRFATIAVDHNGKVFIAFTIHSLYNYANPTGITFGTEFYYDLYCVNNLSGSWVVEQIGLHDIGNFGPIVENIFVDHNNNVHVVANRYGWGSVGGEAWEWIRSSTTNTWGTRATIVQFNDAGIDRFIGDKYLVLSDTSGNTTIIAGRIKPDSPKLFYVRNTGSGWETPVELSDNIAVAWNRYDAVIDPNYNSYIAFLYNNLAGLPELKVSTNFQTPVTANIPLAPTDTLNYFTLHCDGYGNFTMMLWIKNKNVHVSFSEDMIDWTTPIEFPNDLKNYFSGLMVRTDTRQGYFTTKARQITAVAGQRGAVPYGPDTLKYSDITYYTRPTTPSLLYPGNGVVIDTPSVEFAWSESHPLVDNYWFEIADNQQFNNSFIDSSLTQENYTYNNILPLNNYYWRVKAKNYLGWGDFSDVNTFSTLFVPVEFEGNIVKDFTLEQNYPNPFNPETKISFSIPERSFVELNVYNILGIKIASVVSEELPAGNYSVNFDGANHPSGIYIYKITAGKFTSTRKMTLIK